MRVEIELPDQPTNQYPTNSITDEQKYSLTAKSGISRQKNSRKVKNIHRRKSRQLCRLQRRPPMPPVHNLGFHFELFFCLDPEVRGLNYMLKWIDMWDLSGTGYRYRYRWYRVIQKKCFFFHEKISVCRMSDLYPYWKCNFLITNPVLRFVYHLFSGGKLHFHAPIGALVYAVLMEFLS